MKDSIMLETRAGREAFSRRIIEEGAVLLRNKNNLLPLSLNEKIAVFGIAQLPGYFTFFEKRPNNIDIGLTQALMQVGFSVDTELYDKYAAWKEKQKYSDYEISLYASRPEMPITYEDVFETKERGATVAVHIINRFSTENVDMRVEKGNYLLRDEDADILENLNKVYDKIIVVLAMGGCMDLEFLEKYNISSVLYVGTYTGIGGNNAVADIICGEANPSGRMVQTLARHYEDYLSSQWFGEHNGGLVQDYHEDIFIGYRYFDTFKKDDCVLFPFGFGLSYTKFELSDITCNITDKVQIGVTVTNVGDRAGKEVIESFFSAPQMSDGALLSKPLRQFCGFNKTKLLHPTESQRLTIEFSVDEMASYDDIGVLGNKSVWVMEKGDYQILLTANGKDFQNIGTYTEKDTRVTEYCHHIETTLDYRILADGSREELPKPSLDRNRYHGISGVETTNISFTDFAECSNENAKSFGDLKAGDTVSFRFLAGSGGGYRFKIKKDGKAIDYSDKISVSVNDVEVANTVNEDNTGSINLILGRFAITFTVLKEFDADTLTFDKVDAKSVINAEGTSVVGAEEWYEGVIDTNITNYIDADGNKGCCLSNLWRRGMVIAYRLDVKEAGVYDLSFRYSFPNDDCLFSERITFCLSNLAQSSGETMLERTHIYGEPRRFKDTKPFGIFLPKGISYLKICTENTPCPEIDSLIFTRNENAVIPGVSAGNNEEGESGPVEFKYNLLTNEHAERVGMQFEEVYKNPELIDRFLEELSNKELATLVSGTLSNRVKYGNVGCNIPVQTRGVPPMQTADGPGGLWLRGLSPVSFPSCVMVSSTFDREMFRLSGEAIGLECLRYDIDLFLGPGINMFRNPCGGRNSGYYSEDPFLCGIASAEFIKGVQKYGVGAVAKHYCANNTEFERIKSNSRVSERALREIYMRAFEISVKLANPWSIMTSYNFINDVKSSEIYPIINEIPRKEWNWDGIFMTDWWNAADCVNEVRVGHDLRMPDGNVEVVCKALDDGSLKREEAYECGRRILKTAMKMASVRRDMEKYGRIEYKF